MIETIRTARLADAAWLSAVHRKAFPPSEGWSAEVITLQLELPNVLGLYDRRGGMILLRVAADEAEVLTIGVIPSARRQGIARALLQAACENARAFGASQMFLEMAVTNAGARALYAGCGFREVGIRRRYYADGTDAAVMCARLDSA
ncbi:MAG: GNAT family N-acetyltransferase [Acetobacteraceae bacterium]